MELEEFYLKIKSNNFNIEDFNECLLFLTNEFNKGILHMDLIYELCFSTRNIDSITPLINLHELADKYIKNSSDDPEIWKTYLIEMEYYYYVDCPSEVMKYANKLLMINDINVSKTEAYTYAIMVFFRLGLYKEAVKYIDEADIYIKNNQLSIEREFEILINEVDVLSSAGLKKRFLLTLEKINNCLNNMISLPYYDAAKLFYDIHSLYGMVVLNEELNNDKKELFKQFQDLLATLRKYAFITDNFATVFIPLFRFFKDELKTDDAIDEISKILKYRMNISERVALFKYLIEEVKIDTFKYPDIFKEYVSVLSEYFNVNQDNKVSEVYTEILNFSLEKKLDVISAKYHYDPLTGCYNRVFLSEIEERKLEAGDVVIYMDLNDFKKINDTYGHEVGDKQLKIFADILLHHFEGDIVLRLGGDEFVVLTRGLPEDVLAKIDEARKEYLTHNILKNRYGFSAGVLFGKDIMLHEAIGLADMAMYDSKNTGLPVCLKEV